MISQQFIGYFNFIGVLSVQTKENCVKISKINLFLNLLQISNAFPRSAITFAWKETFQKLDDIWSQYDNYYWSSEFIVLDKIFCLDSHDLAAFYTRILLEINGSFFILPDSVLLRNIALFYFDRISLPCHRFCEVYQYFTKRFTFPFE